MSQSIKRRVAGLASNSDGGEIKFLLDAILTDLTALRTTVAALVVDEAARVSNHNTLIAKLNLDAGVSDTDYASATAQTSSAPSALTIEE